ncbi:ABC transporter substrate-binding protein [Paenibacillus nanensis]|uniref:ABC transporter substrate-binding protein n=2 Tax=Paenibacillus nanensis TaxID=393251 RepID=A0A3A1V9U5_9BACL|nr:ABC transporter substrate-binding protein [Paenibacillus nanensis]
MLALTACGGANDGNSGQNAANAPQTDNPATNNTANEAADTKLKVVTSFYPLYFMATEIGGDHVEAVNLIAAGIEPHDWTPKSRDLSVASSAGLLLYHGAGLELWIDQFQEGLSKDSKVQLKEMSAGIELIEGGEEAEEHSGEEGHEHEEEGHDHAVDPHTWVSPKSAIVLAENVKNSLTEADPSNAADYEARYEALKEKLAKLDQAYTEALSAASQKNMVVSHQAFGYLARDYGLHQTAIMGLSPDAEPKAQDLLEIAKFVKENDVKYIFFEELVSDRLAKTLADEADVETMVLNPLEGLTKQQEKAGETYLTLMEQNLQKLIQALQ